VLVHAPAYQDMDFAVGHSYLYLVRAVAQFGPDTVESMDSNEVVVTATDVFPPAAPQGLVAVIIPATPGAPTYVELSWSISPEADFAGYEVYRSEQPDTQGERLNSELLSAPTFRDINVTVGRQYFYHVRAVDHAGNEGPFSAEAEADLTGR
jgi:fibronectin type 3 domain-containing protein